MTASQLVSYDFFKDALLTSNLMSEGMPLHFTASAAAGTIATTICAPADVLKSRVMNQKGAGQGVMSILSESLRTEGPRFLFRGWLPAWSESYPFEDTRGYLRADTISPFDAKYNLHVYVPRAD
jgi:dicarboxylate transporter 10